MRVAWKTDSEAADAAVVFAKNLSLEEGRTASAERSVQYLAARAGGYHHVATLRGLEPGARYEYRVVCDGAASETRSFRSAPVAGEGASFLVLGDMGFGELGQAVASRRQMELLRDSVDAVLHVGDVSYADIAYERPAGWCPQDFCYEAVYDDFMDWIENITDSMPYMVAVGNHEVECHSPACAASDELKESLRNFSAYNARWAMPSAESGGAANMWYSFDYGSVHFVVVNTETDFPGAPEEDAGGWLRLPAGHFAAEGAYLAWLEADLKAANSRRGDRPWIVALGHRPWVMKDGETRDKAVHASHAALFERYGVDLYLTGHVHSYHRLLPRGNNTATPIIITGGAGCDEFVKDREQLGTWDESGQNDQWDYRYFDTETQVGLLKATPTELSFTAIGSESGRVLDSVVIPSRVRSPELLV